MVLLPVGNMQEVGTGENRFQGSCLDLRAVAAPILILVGKLD